MPDIDMNDPAFLGLKPIIDQLRKRADTRLLVAGGPPSLYPEDVRNAPRVEFWYSNEHSAKMSSKTVPDRVSAIVFNKHLDHTLTNNLRNESRRLGIPMCPSPLGMGVITSLIKHTGLDQDVPVVSDAPAIDRDEPVRPAYGAIRAFLAAEANFAPASGPGAEVDRLFKLATERGIVTTRNTINSSYYALRKQREEGTVPAPRFANTPKLTIVTPSGARAEVEPLQPSAVSGPLLVNDVTLVTSTPVVNEVITPVAAPAAIPKPAEVLRLLEDAIAGLQLAHDAVKAIEPTLLEAEEARGLITQMRRMLGVQQ